MNADQKRDYVAQMYLTREWKRKVKRMPDDQIFAIYMRDRDKKETELVAKEAAKKNPIDTLF
jgi:ribosomal protein L34E